jgi:hypothetical protein
MSRKILLLKTPEEQDRTKPLYREIFPEDTEEFLDFYYRERPKRILAMEEDGVVIAMLHLNPFLLSFFGKEITASYIYAVATRKDKRKQGIMGELLSYSFQLLKEEGEAFCFLLPVMEKIYTPYGFQTVAKFITDEPETFRESEEKAGKDTKLLLSEKADVLKAEKLSDYKLYAIPTEELLSRREEEARFSSEEDELPEHPVIMMKILNKELFCRYTGYPEEGEEELLHRLSKEKLYFRDDI